MRLVWNDAAGRGVVNNEAREWRITEKPALGFAYDGIFYDDFREHYVHLKASGGQVDMTAAERAAVRAYIEALATPDPPAPSAAEIINQITNAVQAHLDGVARTRSYDGILSLCSYATSLNPTFSAEGQAGVEWRDAVWAYCYQVLADVQGGLRAVPTPAELIAELPEIDW